MSYEATLSILQSHNYPSFRIRCLEYILHGLLQNKLYSREEIRKYYYEGMAAYYSVEHSNPNKIEAIIEANLVDKVESVFLEAVNRRELSEVEKQKIREEHARYIQMFTEAEKDSKKWLDELKCEWIKFPDTESEK